MKSHLLGLDLGRLLGVLLIVVVHAGTATEYVGSGWERSIWEFFYYRLAPMALPSFFFLSGYLTFRSTTFYRHILFRRTRRLVIPYIAWNLLCILIFLLASCCFARVGMRVEQYGLNTGWGILCKFFDVYQYPLVQPLWYVRTLFLLIVFGIPLLRDLLVPKRKLWRHVSVIGAILIFFSLEGIRTIPAYAVICFYLGGWLARNAFDLTNGFYRWRWYFLSWTLLYALLCTYFGEPIPLVHQCLWSTTAPTLWAFTPYFARWEARLGPWRASISRISFFIFAGHFLFASTLLHLIGPQLPQLPGMLTLLSLIFVVAGSGVCVIVWRIGNRLCPNAVRLLDGSR